MDPDAYSCNQPDRDHIAVCHDLFDGLVHIWKNRMDHGMHLAGLTHAGMFLDHSPIPSIKRRDHFTYNRNIFFSRHVILQWLVFIRKKRD
jgi:hypothetical protein